MMMMMSYKLYIKELQKIVSLLMSQWEILTTS